MFDSIINWWDRVWMDDLSAWLAEAKDPTEIDYRLRAWNEHERRGRPPLL